MQSQTARPAPKKVLIIDDSVQTHQAFKIMLNRYKCEVITAVSGHRGLHQLTGNPEIDLLIVDMNMPHMSGTEFIRRVKEREACRHIPIIAVGSRGRNLDIDEAAVGAQGNIKKPFTSSELHALISMLFPKDNLKLSA
jgi:CheY-like chemotaxis protein